jgi:hypothetical protein
MILPRIPSRLSHDPSPKSRMHRRAAATGVVLALAAALVAIAAAPRDARAETFQTCTGFITSIPTTISAQGTWCLSHDVATLSSSGDMIDITVNNVTIDCNGFKVGGLGGGLSTLTRGIHATNRANITVRNCNIRGFAMGIEFEGDSGYGHAVLDNRLDGNRAYGVFIDGTGHVVRGNTIVDTGSTPYDAQIAAIWLDGEGDVIDNTIDGVFPSTEPTPVGSVGIAIAKSYGASIRDNRVRGVEGGTGWAYGIVGADSFTSIDNNVVSLGTGTTAEFAIACTGTGTVTNNHVWGFAGGLACADDGGNVVK